MRPMPFGSRPLAAEFVSRNKEASMFYSILPSAVQSRLPRLPSLHRSASRYGLATKRNSANSRPPSGAGTPPDYTTALVLSGGALVGEEDTAGYVLDNLSNSSEEDILQMGSDKGRRTPGVELTESSSGIGWKFANQGTHRFLGHKMFPNGKF